MDQIPSYLRSIDQVLTPVVSSEATTTKFSFDTTPIVSYGSQTTGVTTPVNTSSAEKRMKFMLVSTHAHQFTGYSKVSYGILQELSKLPWLDCVHYGFQKHPQVSPQYR